MPKLTKKKAVKKTKKASPLKLVFSKVLPILFIGLLIGVILFISHCLKPRETWDVLSKKEKKQLHQILDHWKTWVPERQQDGSAPLITFEELYQDLDGEHVRLLEKIRHIDPRERFGFQGAYLGENEPDDSFIRIDEQWITQNGKRTKVAPQYLPVHVYQAFKVMMQAMKNKLGKELLVESGYRSPAYQLYTFAYYMPKHHHSLLETGRWVAIPGYSEHGAPHRQAIDFINEEGINGEDRVEDFEVLPEYEWLTKNAHHFGFELSYPRGHEGITFEPWHWRYVKERRGRIVFPDIVLTKVLWSQEEKKQDIATRELKRTEFTSHHLIHLRTSEKPHAHAQHDLTVFVLKGKAEMNLGVQTLEVEAGDVIDVPKGTVHWAKNLHPESSEVYAIFSPPLES